MNSNDLLLLNLLVKSLHVKDNAQSFVSLDGRSDIVSPIIDESIDEFELEPEVKSDIGSPEPKDGEQYTL